jgi:uncharacterized protein
MSPRTISISLPVPGVRTGWLAVGLALGMLVAVLAGPLLSTKPALATDGTSTPPEHTISVAGTGKVVLSPDVADIRLGVSATARTVKAARQAAATSMTAVIAALRKLGIAEADIQTTTLSLQPTYDYSYNTNPPRLTGYVLSNAIAVTVRDIEKVGDAIDDALAAGATTLDGVGFRVADQASAEAQARTAAMTEAAAKAKTLADAAGVSIKGVASISETVAAIPYPIYYAGAAAGAKDVQTPVQPGTSDVSVTVAVVYLIG